MKIQQIKNKVIQAFTLYVLEEIDDTTITAKGKLLLVSDFNKKVLEIALPSKKNVFQRFMGE